MKIRTGFVSNSSSSSFLIAGVERNWCQSGEQDHLNRLLDAIDRLHPNKASIIERFNENCNQGVYNEEYITLYGNDGEIYYAGWDIERLLNAGETLPDIIKKFEERVKEKYGIKVEMKLIYGECST